MQCNTANQTVPVHILWMCPHLADLLQWEDLHISAWCTGVRGGWQVQQGKCMLLCWDRLGRTKTTQHRAPCCQCPVPPSDWRTLSMVLKSNWATCRQQGEWGGGGDDWLFTAFTPGATESTRVCRHAENKHHAGRWHWLVTSVWIEVC